MVFNLPDCSLACSFSISNAIAYSRISANTPCIPLRRSRRKCRSSFSTPKAPSDWMLRLIRSRMPFSLLILSREAARAASNAQLTLIVLFPFALVQCSLQGQSVQSFARYTLTVCSYPLFVFRFRSPLNRSSFPAGQVKQFFSLSYGMFSHK